MITPAYALTATERVLPRLALDWTTGLAQPGVDVTRAGVATFVGSNGLIQSASVNTQRLDWTTSTSGLLVEEARTNNCISSSEIGSGAWSFLPNYTVQLNNGVSPDGTTNASNIYPLTSGSPRWTFRAYSYTASQAHTLSVFAKSNAKRWLCIYNPSGAGPGAAWFDLVDGVVGSVAAGFTSTITSLGNGYYRCTVTYTAPASGTQYFAMSDVNADLSLTTTASGTSGILVYGAQVELGAFATSYIPTDTTAVTRNADVATMTGTNFSDWYNPTEGTFDVSFSATGLASYSGAFWVSDAAKTSSRGFSCGVNATTNFGFLRGADGALKSLTLGAYVANTTESIVLSYTASNFYGSANASAVSSASITAFPTSETLNIGFQSTAGGSTYLNGRIKKLNFYALKVTSAEMQAFSKG